MTSLTISQGLRQASKLKGQLAELQTRASAAVTYKASAKPAFDFGATVEKLESVRAELTQLETRIALANAKATVTFDGAEMPLTQAVRTLQELKGTIAWIKTVPSRAQAETTEEEWTYDDDMKRVKTVVTWKCDLPEAARAERAEALQAKFDALNDLVEQVNHVTTI